MVITVPFNVPGCENEIEVKSEVELTRNLPPEALDDGSPMHVITFPDIEKYSGHVPSVYIIDGVPAFVVMVIISPSSVPVRL